jgi:hypothetical protein
MIKEVLADLFQILYLVLNYQNFLVLNFQNSTSLIEVFKNHFIMATTILFGLYRSIVIINKFINFQILFKNSFRLLFLQKINVFLVLLLPFIIYIMIQHDIKQFNIGAVNNLAFIINSVIDFYSKLNDITNSKLIIFIFITLFLVTLFQTSYIFFKILNKFNLIKKINDLLITSIPIRIVMMLPILYYSFLFFYNMLTLIISFIFQSYFLIFTVLLLILYYYKVPQNDFDMYNKEVSSVIFADDVTRYF